jgi:hypothetical protein
LIKGKTDSGFEYKVSKDVANDYELVEILGDLEENPLLLTKLVNKVLGKEQANNLKEHIRNEEGIVSTDVMMKEVMAIFNGEKEIKNS